MIAHELTQHAGWYARLEGGDGVGKTTILQLAKDYDEQHGIGAVFIREPGGTDLGMELRQILLHGDYNLSPEAQLLLMTADRRHLWDTVISPALAEGRPVISDRGYESTVAYQGAQGVDLASIADVHHRVLPEGYINPSAVAILSLSDAARAARISARLEASGMKADNFESMDGGFHTRVREIYRDWIPKHLGGVVIDADAPPEVVFERAKPYLFGPHAGHGN